MSAFWDDLNRRMEDPVERRHFILERTRIAAIDEMVNQLDGIRETLGLSKAELARTIDRNPQSVRRLLTAPSSNPQFSLIVEIAAALGCRLVLEPMSAKDKREIATPLRELASA